jgi:hypothetical protein
LADLAWARMIGQGYYKSIAGKVVLEDTAAIIIDPLEIEHLQAMIAHEMTEHPGNAWMDEFAKDNMKVQLAIDLSVEEDVIEKMVKDFLATQSDIRATETVLLRLKQAAIVYSWMGRLIDGLTAYRDHQDHSVLLGRNDAAMSSAAGHPETDLKTTVEDVPDAAMNTSYGMTPEEIKTILEGAIDDMRMPIEGWLGVFMAFNGKSLGISQEHIDKARRKLARQLPSEGFMQSVMAASFMLRNPEDFVNIMIQFKQQADKRGALLTDFHAQEEITASLVEVKLKQWIIGSLQGKNKGGAHQGKDERVQAAIAMSWHHQEEWVKPYKTEIHKLLSDSEQQDSHIKFLMAGAWLDWGEDELFLSRRQEMAKILQEAIVTLKDDDNLLFFNGFAVREYLRHRVDFQRLGFSIQDMDREILRLITMVKIDEKADDFWPEDMGKTLFRILLAGSIYEADAAMTATPGAGKTVWKPQRGTKSSEEVWRQHLPVWESKGYDWGDIVLHVMHLEKALEVLNKTQPSWVVAPHQEDLMLRFFEGRRVLNVALETEEKYFFKDRNIWTDLRRRGIDAWALDPTPSIWSYDNGHYIQSTIEGAPASAGQFDDIISDALFDEDYYPEHFRKKHNRYPTTEDYEPIAKKFKSLLKPGGRLYLTVWGGGTSARGSTKGRF